MASHARRGMLYFTKIAIKPCRRPPAIGGPFHDRPSSRIINGFALPQPHRHEHANGNNGEHADPHRSVCRNGKPSAPRQIVLEPAFRQSALCSSKIQASAYGLSACPPSPRPHSPNTHQTGTTRHAGRVACTVFFQPTRCQMASVMTICATQHKKHCQSIFHGLYYRT